VVDINLRSPESVQVVRNKLRADAYRAVPRLFVLADALHHGTMQAWALAQRTRYCARSMRKVFCSAYVPHFRTATDSTPPRWRGFEHRRGSRARGDGEDIRKLPAGVPLTFSDVVEAENKILKAIKHSSLRQWLTTVGCHHTASYAIACSSPALPWRSRSISGCVRTTSAVWPAPPCCTMSARRSSPWRSWTSLQKLTDEEMRVIRMHPRLGYDVLAAEGSFPPEMLDVVLHHHELLDGTGYPNGLRGNQISDIVRLTTVVDIYAALVEDRAYRLAFTHAKAFAIMEQMDGKLDRHLLQHSPGGLRVLLTVRRAAAVSKSFPAIGARREERKRRSNPVLLAAFWIASRSLSSGAHSRDRCARHDGVSDWRLRPAAVQGSRNG